MKEKIFFMTLLLLGTGTFGSFVFLNTKKVADQSFFDKILSNTERKNYKFEDINPYKTLISELRFDAVYTKDEKLFNNFNNFFYSAKNYILSNESYINKDYYEYLKSYISYSKNIFSNLEARNLDILNQYLPDFEKILHKLDFNNSNLISYLKIYIEKQKVENQQYTTKKDKKQVEKTRPISKKTIIKKQNVKTYKEKSSAELLDDIIASSINEVKNTDIEKTSTNFLDEIISSSLDGKNNNTTKTTKLESTKIRQEELARQKKLEEIRKQEELARQKKLEEIRQKELLLQQKLQQLQAQQVDTTTRAS